MATASDLLYSAPEEEEEVPHELMTYQKVNTTPKSRSWLMMLPSP